MTWLLSLLPGGQIVGLGATIVNLLGKLIKGIIEGITVCIANPVVFLILAITFIGGVYEGTRWNAKKLDVARQEITRMKAEWKRANEEQQARLDRALADADRAEKAARAAAVKSGAGDARRVRSPAPAPPAPAGSGLSWVSPFSKSN